MGLAEIRGGEEVVPVARGPRLRTLYVVELPLLSKYLLHRTREYWIKSVAFSRHVMWQKQATSKPQKPLIKNINSGEEGPFVCVFAHISDQNALCLVI